MKLVLGSLRWNVLFVLVMCALRSCAQDPTNTPQVQDFDWSSVRVCLIVTSLNADASNADHADRKPHLDRMLLNVPMYKVSGELGSTSIVIRTLEKFRRMFASRFRYRSTMMIQVVISTQ
jgi:hypothetical protein